MSKTISKDILDKIKKGIEEVRPYLKADGGDVELVEVNERNDVKVRLLGTCNSCPFSVMTLKAGIEQAIKKEWPDINSIEAI